MTLGRSIADMLPAALRVPLRNFYRRFAPVPAEPMMYRVHLFDELLAMTGGEAIRGTRILEIGPRDGLDSRRLASLDPAELVMIDLPEKREIVAPWIGEIACPHRYIEANFMYMPEADLADLGRFSVIWCTGVLYHNAEQLRFLRKLFKLLNPGGRLVLESSTFRGPKRFRDGCYIEIHFPRTFRDTGTVTHLPTAGTIKAWLEMVGFGEIRESGCFEQENRNLIGRRMACIARKDREDGPRVYYGKSGLNPDYRFGDAV